MNCYSIHSGKNFLQELAKWLLERYSDPLEFSSCLVLLPSRRACRALREVFLEAGGGKPMLLPRIQPLGDMEAPPLIHDTQFLEILQTIPPAIHAKTRSLLLCELVMRFAKLPIHQAFPLAQELAAWLDEAAQEECDLEKLAGLVPEEYATHWQEILKFLSIVSHHWPEILKARGEIDPGERQKRVLAALANLWAVTPPSYPVIVAGSTGSIPATAELIGTVARMPGGSVILPGLDHEMEEADWKILSATHPQFGLKQLLGRISLDRSDVVELKEPAQSLWPVVFAATQATARWPTTPKNLLATLAKTKILEADIPLNEARMIAIKLREVLETPGKTAALITPDRTLARMVAAQMERYGVTLDDSAGIPIKDTPGATLMRLLLDAIATDLSPSALLALMRHPLAAGGINPAQCREYSRVAELKLFRGVRLTRGIQGLRKAVDHCEELPAEVATHLLNITGILAPLAELKHAPLAEVIRIHIEAAEKLATTDTISGVEILWQGDSGNQLAQALADWKLAANVSQTIDAGFYPALFEHMLAGETFRPAYGLHPRLHILGPLEARLLTFDTVILASLNEGTWPQAAKGDPWMSRPMRESFGLPPHERRVGQSAHDIWMQVHAGEVWLTRARKSEGAPTTASRWWIRLQTLVSGLDKEAWQRMDASFEYYAKLAAVDNFAEQAALTQPSVNPPENTRPKELYVTAVDMLLSNPYVFYAKHILKLTPLKPLDQEPDAADFGKLIHRVFERFCKLHPKILPADSLSVLRSIAQTVFAEMLDRPAVAALWWPRFEAIAGLWLAHEITRRDDLKEILSEQKVNRTFGKLRLGARIDRIDIRQDDTLAVIDYKTGQLPTAKEVREGLATQLGLSAYILAESMKDHNVTGLEYWKLASNEKNFKIQKSEDAKASIEAAVATLEKLIEAYWEQLQPFKAAQYDNRNSDYAHFIRAQEWEAV